MPEVESTVESRGAVTHRVTVRVPPERVAQALDAAYAQLSRKAKIPGFRRGKVPRNILERHYGEGVRADVIKDVVDATCGEALQQHGLDVVSAPMLVEKEQSGDGGLRYVAEVEVRPTFTLHDYQGRDLVRRVARVTEADVDDAIQRLRERMARLEAEQDRVTVARGDVVVFDMYAFSEGVPISSASGEGVTLEVGSGRFPEEFEKQIVGVTRGIRTPIDVRFPAEYQDAALAGKFVRFEVTVREIKNKILPALDDEFVRELDFAGCDTLADLRVKVRGDLERHARQDAERRARNRLLERYVDEHEFELPRSHVERQIASMLHDMGIHEAPEDKIEELKRAVEPSAVKHVKARFILDAIAKKESLQVSDEELTSEVNRQIVAAGSAGARVREHYSDRASVLQLYANMVRDKALDRILEVSAQSDEEVDRSELADGR
jgi:trigger factor